jgi:GT2 family glycosyltransferase
MLTTSIVLYNHTVSEIAPLVEELKKSVLVSKIFLVDNSPVEGIGFRELGVEYVFTGNNIGYGAAHNIAIRQSIADKLPYHLVINPDISFDFRILDILLEYLNNHTDIGQIMPKVYYPDGEIQYLCKLLPTPFDLIFRRFLPASLTMKRMERFELRASGYDRVMEVPYLSGCFMLLRTAALVEVGLFDERFFMYPEDIDLTRRMHRKYRTVFYPEVSIVHHHAKSSYTSPRMLWIHISNMIRYFNKWGWLFDAERRQINKKTLKQLV